MYPNNAAILLLLTQGAVVLSDDIYAAMKNTLARHTTVLGKEYPAETDIQESPINLSRLVPVYPLVP